MKITIPDAVTIAELPDGHVLLDRHSQKAFCLDPQERQLWTALTASRTVEAAHEWLCQHAGTGTPIPPVDELSRFVNRLADRRLVQITYAGRASRAFKSLKRHGLVRFGAMGAGAIRRRVDRWIDGQFDRTFGTDTGGVIPVAATGASGPSVQHAGQFVPTATRVFLQGLEEAVPQPQGRVFIDYGSGKGRTLLLASNWAFKRIIGIELSQRLNDTAQRNIRMYRNPAQRCVDVASYCCDTVDFEVPDEPLVLYLWSPFRGPVLDSVIKRLRASYARRRRPLTVMLYTEGEDLIRAFSALPLELTCREIRLKYVPNAHQGSRMFVLTSGPDASC